jgi:hypothetical protein
LDQIPICSVRKLWSFIIAIKLKDSRDKYSSLVNVIITRFPSGYFIIS